MTANARRGNVTSFQIQMVVFIVNGLLEAVKYGFIINVESFEQMQRKLWAWFSWVATIQHNLFSLHAKKSKFLQITILKHLRNKIFYDNDDNRTEVLQRKFMNWIDVENSLSWQPFRWIKIAPKIALLEHGTTQHFIRNYNLYYQNFIKYFRNIFLCTYNIIFFVVYVTHHTIYFYI